MAVRRYSLLLTFFLLSRIASAAPPPLPNIIIITLDTTRADRMGFMGSTRGLTPNLDALAKEGIVFPRAYSHVPLTTASHTTILTGTYPQFNHVNDFGISLSKNLPYLPDILHLKGYHTGAFVGSLILDPLDGTAPGFDRGFDVYDAGFHLRRHGTDRYKSVERRAEDVVNHALSWLSRVPEGPFFLWVHFYDAHDPYDPPLPFKTQYASAPYDGEIAYTDSAVGKLFAELRRHQLFDETLIVVMADHGESLGAHGENTHGIFLYDDTLHVPLVIKLPLNRDAGKRLETRAGLVDVAPTILQEAGVAIPKEMQGQPLLPKTTAPPRAHSGQTQAPNAQLPEDRPVYAETDYPHRAFGWTKPDPEQAKKLQALGYVASEEGSARDEKVLSGADPKSKIEISNLLHDAMFDVEDARYQEALPMLEKVLAQEPEMPVANMQYGMAQARLRNYAKAIAPLQKAVKLQPDNGMGHYELGLALFETGDWKSAAPQFEASVERAPRWADAHFSLAAVYARIDRVPDAMTELDTTLGLSPDHYRANLLRGRILSLQGNPAAAVMNLEQAVAVQPDSREAHLFLARAYEQLGRVMDAAKEKVAAEKLESPAQP